MEYTKLVEHSTEGVIEIDTNFLVEYVPILKELITGANFKFIPKLLMTYSPSDDENWILNPNADFSIVNEREKLLNAEHLTKLFAIMQAVNNFLLPFCDKNENEVQLKEGRLEVVSQTKDLPKLKELIRNVRELKSLLELKENQFDRVEVKFSGKRRKDDKRIGSKGKRLYNDGETVMFTEDASHYLLNVAVKIKSADVNRLLGDFPGLYVYFCGILGSEFAMDLKNVGIVLTYLEDCVEDFTTRNHVYRLAVNSIVKYLNFEVRKLEIDPKMLTEKDCEIIYCLFFQFGFLERELMEKKLSSRQMAKKIRSYFMHKDTKILKFKMSKAYTHLKFEHI